MYLSRLILFSFDYEMNLDNVLLLGKADFFYLCLAKI